MTRKNPHYRNPKSYQWFEANCASFEGTIGLWRWHHLFQEQRGTSALLQGAHDSEPKAAFELCTSAWVLAPANPRRLAKGEPCPRCLGMGLSAQLGWIPISQIPRSCLGGLIRTLLVVSLEPVQYIYKTAIIPSLYTVSWPKILQIDFTRIHNEEVKA